MFTLESSNLPEVVPYSPWLDDDILLEDLPKERFGRLIAPEERRSVMLHLGIAFIILLFIPIFVLYIIVKRCQTKLL